MRGLRRGCGAVILAAVLSGSLVGCGLQVPADPDGSLDRLTGGILRAGASPESGLVNTTGGSVTGPLADLVEGFAERQSATVEWTVGSEETLVTGLEDGQLDIVIGGMTSNTPWADRAGVTRGYPAIPGTNDRDIVLLVPLGENRLLSELEFFLDAEVTP